MLSTTCQLSFATGLKGTANAWWKLSDSKRDGWKFRAQAAYREWQSKQAAEGNNILAMCGDGGQTLEGGEHTSPLCGGGQSLEGCKRIQPLPPCGVEEATFLRTGAYDVATTDYFFQGRGTFGTVYRGTHTLSGHHVAMKIFNGKTATDVNLREIEIYKLVHVSLHVP